MTIDDTQAAAYALLSNLAMLDRRHERGIAHCDKALALTPNADVMAHCARIWTYVGREHEALDLIRRSMRLSPYFPGWYYFVLGNAHRLMERYNEAIAPLESWRNRNPNSLLPIVVLAYTYAQAGRKQEAVARAKEILERNPGFSIKRYAKTILFYRDPANVERVVDGLRMAGLPERRAAADDNAQWSVSPSISECLLLLRVVGRRLLALKAQ